jgi:dTMP kinase
MAARFISFEGGEGGGKSTQTRLLAARLRNAGQSVVLTREPGGTPGAEAIRDLLVTGDPGRWTPWTEACLATAARVDHVARVVRPALAAGAWVICDRYVDSTRAYQGAGKGIADADLCDLHARATGDLWPDLTIVLIVSPEIGLNRAGARADGEGRFEAHDAAFHARVAAFFAALPAAEPARCKGFDAALPIEALAGHIFAAVQA